MAGEWQTAVGETLSRRERSRLYGGGLYGGMEPSAVTPNVFLYSDPAAGGEYGYDYDGWSEDGRVFLYTGEGQDGDQRLASRGNGALANHAKAGKAVRLFLADGVVRGTQEKIQRYAGEFRLDPDESYVLAPARDRNGRMRKVYVFRLLPVGEAVRRERDRSSTGDLATDGRPRRRAAEPVPVESAETPPGCASAVSLEAVAAGTYETATSTGVTAVKTEAALVARFADALTRGGSSPVRYRICPPGESVDLYTDVYDTATDTLYEAKGVATREAIRMALGQLLDYRRHVPPVKALAVLLPSRPSDDLVSLLGSHGVRCVYEVEPGAFTVAN